MFQARPVDFCAILSRVVFLGVVLLALAPTDILAQQQNSKQTRPQPAQQGEGGALATKPCTRGVAEEWDNCNGVSEFQNGDRYVGNFRKGLPDGIGTYYWKNGREYFGEFKRGLPNGKGKFTDLSNSVYIGDFVDGRMSGKATVDYQNGAKYVGEYKDDRKNGKGTYTYANGDKFIGEFADDEMTPNGILELANGDSYVGSFKSLKPNGKGTYTFKDGRKFAGEFIAGEPQGQGTLSGADGTMIASGVFKGWDAIASADPRPVADASAMPQPLTAPDATKPPETNKVVIFTPSATPEAAPQTPAPEQPSKAPEKPAQQPLQAAPTPTPSQPSANQATSPAAAPVAKADIAKATASPQPQATQGEASSPVVCRYRNGFWFDVIECDIVEETAEIKEIVLNRGKCQTATEGLKQLKEMAEKDGGNLTRVFRTAFLKTEDFRGQRKFGDRIEIPVVGCPNLLEFTVEANGTFRTWKTY